MDSNRRLHNAVRASNFFCEFLLDPFTEKNYRKCDTISSASKIWEKSVKSDFHKPNLDNHPVSIQHFPHFSSYDALVTFLEIPQNSAIIVVE